MSDKGVLKAIHNWSLQPFSQDYDQASDITYVVYVNFTYE